MGLSGSSLSLAMTPRIGQVGLSTLFPVLVQPSFLVLDACGKKFGIGGHRPGGAGVMVLDPRPPAGLSSTAGGDQCPGMD